MSQTATLKGLAVNMPGTGQTAAPDITATGDEVYDAAVAVAPAASNAAYILAIKQATLQLIYLLFTAAAAPGATQNCTVKTNSSGSPQETIVLVSGIPKVFATGPAGTAGTNPFAGDVTEFFITDSTTNAVGGSLVIKFLNNR